jgi:hypothetical protein
MKNVVPMALLGDVNLEMYMLIGKGFELKNLILNEGILSHCINLFYFFKNDALCRESIHHNLGI